MNLDLFWTVSNIDDNAQLTSESEAEQSQTLKSKEVIEWIFDDNLILNYKIN